MSRTLSAVMSRFTRGPLIFLAGWAERGLLAIGVLLSNSIRVFTVTAYGGFMDHIQGKPPELVKVSHEIQSYAVNYTPRWKLP